MVKPLLNKPYAPSHATDVRQAFELERHRLATEETDRLNGAFGAALAIALLEASVAKASRRAAKPQTDADPADARQAGVSSRLGRDCLSTADRDD